jgi:Di-haem cytochrome c peroxidase
LSMATNIPPDMAAAIQANPSYPQLFNAAFGDPGITAVRIAFAIATYERTVVPNQAPWDRFIAGDTNALTLQQRQGWNLLRNNTECLNCHRPPTFSDNRFHNIGLRPANEDLGRQVVTGNPADRGDFKTMSLRNSGLKRALMHVGWITNINDAIDFYISGTNTNSHTQFTADQDNIPMGGGSYNNIDIPLTTPGGQPFRAAIADFLINGLTDPRVASETFPFDRPTLASEAGAPPLPPPPPGPGAPAMPVSSAGMMLLLMGLLLALGSWNTIREMRRQR